MPLLLIYIQDLPHLLIEQMVILRQPLLQILVNRGFGDAKVLGGRPDRGPCFDHVHSHFAGSFLNGVRHNLPSDAVCYRDTICAGAEAYVREIAFGSSMKLEKI